MKYSFNIYKKVFSFIFAFIIFLGISAPSLGVFSPIGAEITAAAAEVDPLAEGDGNFILPEENSITYQNGINSYGKLSYFTTYLDQSTNHVYTTFLVDLKGAEPKTSLYFIFNNNNININRIVIFNNNRFDWSKAVYFTSYEKNKMYYVNFTNFYMEVNNLIFIDFLTSDVSACREIEYNFIVNSISSATPEYFLGYNQGAKYDQTQITEGSASWNAGYNKGVENSLIDREITTASAANVQPVNAETIKVYNPLWNEGTSDYSNFPFFTQVNVTDNKIQVDSTRQTPTAFTVRLDTQLEPGNYYDVTYTGIDPNLENLIIRNENLAVFYRDGEGLKYLTNIYLYSNTPTTFSPPVSIDTIYIVMVSVYHWWIEGLSVKGATIQNVYTEGFNAGKYEGVTEGLLQGREEAINEGVGGSALWYGAIVFARSLFQMVGDTLGIKIAGDITLGLIVIGIPAVFFIINGVIALATRFLKN